MIGNALTLGEILEELQPHVGGLLPPHLSDVLGGGFKRMKLCWIKVDTAQEDTDDAPPVEAYLEVDEPVHDSDMAVRLRK